VSEKNREIPDRRKVSSLCAGGEAADFHVLDHTLAQWADGFISHGSAPCVGVEGFEHPNLNTGQTRPLFLFRADQTHQITA
jgi:hypothetical protein